MTEMNDKNNLIDYELHSIHKQFLVDLKQDLGSEYMQKICKSVAKNEKCGNKLNLKFIKAYNKNFERIIDEKRNDLKTNEMILENNTTINQTIDQTIDNIIDRQTKTHKINESIVEKQFDLNYIKSEESRLQLIKQQLSNNEISFDDIKNHLKQSQKRSQ